MKILFYFISQINPQSGGTERVADNVAHGLKARGHSVFYMSRTKVNGTYDIPCFFLPDTVGVTQNNINYVNHFCDDNKIDLIINEAGNTDDVRLFSHEYIRDVRIITELHFCPMQSLRFYYHSLHLPIKFKNPKHSIINLCKWIKAPYNKLYTLKNISKNYHYICENSDKVVVLSPSYIKEFADLANVSDYSKIMSIYNPNTFVPSESPLQKEKVVLSIGRLEYSPKRIDLLLDIWKQVYANHNDWTLEICGDGEYKETLEQYVEKNNIQGVKFKGNVTPQSYYERASIMCMTSLNEGTPMVIIEAMQCKCVPIVYDTYSAAKDLIADGETGYIIPPFDKQSYAEKLSRLMEDEDLRQQMADKALTSTKRFDLDKIIDEWEMLIKQLCK